MKKSARKISFLPARKQYFCSRFAKAEVNCCEKPKSSRSEICQNSEPKQKGKPFIYFLKKYESNFTFL